MRKSLYFLNWILAVQQDFPFILASEFTFFSRVLCYILSNYIARCIDKTIVFILLYLQLLVGNDGQ